MIKINSQPQVSNTNNASKELLEKQEQSARLLKLKETQKQNSSLTVEQKQQEEFDDSKYLITN